MRLATILTAVAALAICALTRAYEEKEQEAVIRLYRDFDCQGDDNDGLTVLHCGNGYLGDCVTGHFRSYLIKESPNAPGMGNFDQWFLRKNDTTCEMGDDFEKADASYYGASMTYYGLQPLEEKAKPGCHNFKDTDTHGVFKQGSSHKCSAHVYVGRQNGGGGNVR